eukprot:gene10410-biopygen3789
MASTDTTGHCAVLRCAVAVSLYDVMYSFLCAVLCNAVLFSEMLNCSALHLAFAFGIYSLTTVATRIILADAFRRNVPTLLKIDFSPRPGLTDRGSAWSVATMCDNRPPHSEIAETCRRSCRTAIH